VKTLNESYVIQYMPYVKIEHWNQFPGAYCSLDEALAEVKAIDQRWDERNPHSSSRPKKYRVVRKAEQVVITLP